MKPAVESLKRDYPGMFAECIALGVQQERERILALLPSDTQGREHYAIECIRKGTPLNHQVKASYRAVVNNSSEQIFAEAKKILGGGTMTPEQLLREAPELYASLLEEGIRLERERALAHLDTAERYNSLREATEAIRSGMVVTPGDGLHELLRRY